MYLGLATTTLAFLMKIKNIENMFNIIYYSINFIIFVTFD